MGLFEDAFEAFKWGFIENSKNIGRWVVLTILSIIPIINFFSEGAMLKILKGEEHNLDPAGKSFLTGLLWFIISFIYLLIPLIIVLVSCIPAIGGITALMADPSNIAAGFAAIVPVIIGGFIALIVSILIWVIMTPAMILFVRTGSFGKAFNFKEIFALVKQIGWGQYIIALLVMIVFCVIISFVAGLVSWIPIIGWLVLLVAYVPLKCFTYKFWNGVFAA